MTPYYSWHGTDDGAVKIWRSDLKSKGISGVYEYILISRKITVKMLNSSQTEGV